MTLLRQTWAILRKDLRIEMTRPDLSVTASLLAVATFLLVAFAADRPRPVLAPAALWTGATLAAVLISSRLYRIDFDGRLADMLLAGPLLPQALFLAKTLVALTVLALVTGMGLMLCTLLFSAPLAGSWMLALAVILLGSLGLAEVAGLLGVRMGSGQSDLVATLAMMPLIVPVVLAAGRATAALLGQRMGGPAATWDWLLFLTGFDLAIGTVGLWIFPSLVRP